MAIRGSTRQRESFPAPPSPGIYRKIAYSFVALTIAIVFAALWFSSVRATVRVKVTRDPTPIAVRVQVAAVPNEGEIAGRVVQGVFELIKEYEVKDGAGKTVPGTATGKVRITNDTSNDQPLVVKTRLLAGDGKLFRISETVNVPAGGSVDVSAYSDVDGGAYDVAAGVDFTIPGLSESLQKKIYAESTTVFSGGTRTVRAVRQEDLDAAMQDLEQSVLETAKTTLNAEVADGKFNETVFLVRVVEKKSSEQLGDEADHFLLSLKLDVTGVFYEKSQMDLRIKNGITEGVPKGREIAAQEPLRTDFSVESVDASNETAQVVATAEVLTKITDASEVISKEAILGLPIEEAERELESLAGIDDAEITVRPQWVRRLPTLKDHVTIKVE